MKKFFQVLTALTLCLTAAGCGAQKPETPQYSNLADAATRAEAREVMTAAGLEETRLDVLFDHVDQINAVVPKEQLTEGYAPVGEPKYDPWDLQDAWTAQYPDFMGYNCRITAYSLFQKFVTVPEGAETRLEMLPFDLDALSVDDSAFPDGEASFSTLYSTIPTGSSQEVEPHVEDLQKDWKERGIAFEDIPDVRLISVVFHDVEDSDFLFIGHTGLLFPTEDGLYFLEKLAFQEPYQWVKFQSREQLSDYLMTKYDVNEGQPLAPPFILENDQLMEGYRPKPDA